jgi:hypothetical protein
MVLSPMRAWEAIEAADDALVRYTNHSYEVGIGFVALFDRIATQKPSA